MNESQLIIACKKRNRSAQKALYETYAPKMLGLCMRYCKSNDMAYDFLHDGFIQVFTQIDSYSGKGSFEGWLRRVFVNVILENFRQEKKNDKFLSELKYLEETEMESDDVFFDMSDLSHEKLLSIIRKLPEGYQTVFNLFVFEDMTHKEISRQLGISEGTSRSQYARARKMLQKQVSILLQHQE